MSLLSPEFAVLFMAFLLVYWLAARWVRVQNGLLLAAGYALAAQLDWRFAAVMAGFAALVWGLGKWLSADAGRESTSRLSMALALVLTLLPLVFCKYFDFFREQAQSALVSLDLQVAIPVLPVFLPIGISFYTLSAVTYLVSVHRRELPPASLAELMLFLAFFPVLTAGPICRAGELLPQIRARRAPGATERILVLLMLALLKKWWLAGYLSENWVDPLFANPEQFHALELLCGVYAYALQIYFDFSGYSDLAMAMALMLGFEVPRNFNAPYLARDLKEFWQRWHISLSRWIRDYVYIPLGGNRHGWLPTQAAVLAAMLLSGLWHGAAVHYLLWGALHAAGIVWLNLFVRLPAKWHLKSFCPWLAQFLTIQYVCLTWLWFRASDTPSGWKYLRAMLGNWSETALTLPVFAFLVLAMALWLTQPWWANWPQRLERHLARMPSVYKPVWLSLWAALITLCAPSGIPGFIYAQF